MANIDLTYPPAGSSYRIYNRSPYTIRVVDFAEAATVKGSALAQNDTIDILDLSAGELVQDVFIRTMAAGTAGATVQVGDASSATGYVASVAVDATANTMTQGTGAYLVNGTTHIAGTLYTSAGVLRLTVNSSTAPAAGRIEVFTQKTYVGTNGNI